MRVALLDDYQGVALAMADWKSLPSDTRVEAFHDHLADEHALAKRLRDFDIVVAMRERTPFPKSLLDRLPNLKLLITTGARNPTIDVEAARANGVVVCATGLPAPGSRPAAPPRGLSGVSQLTWGLILALAHNVVAEDRNVRAGGWQATMSLELRGKVLGVIGLGRSGSEVASIGRAFGMQIIAWSQNLTAERAAECGATLVSKEELLARADFVTVHLILSDRTRGLLRASDIELMKPTAYLVNTSRGPIVDEDTLAAALERGQIAGAGLDVFSVEPLPMDHPFRRLENVVVTPHIGYVTRETYRGFYQEALADVHAFLNGSPIRVLEASTI